MRKETRLPLYLESGFSYIATLDIADDDDYGTYFPIKNYFEFGDVYAYFLGNSFTLIPKGKIIIVGA